jgi:hypothetical protein
MRALLEREIALSTASAAPRDASTLIRNTPAVATARRAFFRTNFTSIPGGTRIFKGFPFLSLLVPTLGVSIVCWWASYRMIEQLSMCLARRRNGESRISVSPAVRGHG